MKLTLSLAILLKVSHLSSGQLRSSASCHPTRSPHLIFYFPTNAPVPTQSPTYEATPPPSTMDILTAFPSMNPTVQKEIESGYPSSNPTALAPTITPSENPNSEIIPIPTTPATTVNPTVMLTSKPTISLTLAPTPFPVILLTPDPTQEPTPEATSTPSAGPTISKVFEIISSVALQGGMEFESSSSYQSQALRFIENENIPFSEDRIIQRYALACIYYATYGVSNAWTEVDLANDGTTVPGWKQSNNWIEDNTDECTWFGITCDDISGKVANIQLAQNRLTGSFPPEVTLLSSSLQVIDLYQNEYLQGGVGPNGNAFIGSLTELRAFYFAFCKFESTTGVPTELGLLTNLREFDSAFNIYSGSLDGATFASLTNLLYLDISGGKYDSPLPDELVKLPNLEDFFVTDSFLVGDVSYLTQLSNLYQHTADQNPNLVGKIPDASLMSRNMELLSFSNCGLSGTIPASIGGELNFLQGLYLNGNNLDGTIPTELGLLTLLSEFEVQDNAITGVMPNEICSNRNDGSLLGGLLESLISDCDVLVTCSCCTECER